jgi:hypothetical protein
MKKEGSMAKDREIMTISEGSIQEEFVRNGMEAGEALRMAQEEFLKRVERYLDMDWEIIFGDSHTVYLRKR